MSAYNQSFTQGERERGTHQDNKPWQRDRERERERSRQVGRRQRQAEESVGGRVKGIREIEDKDK